MTVVTNTLYLKAAHETGRVEYFASRIPSSFKDDLAYFLNALRYAAFLTLTNKDNGPFFPRPNGTIESDCGSHTIVLEMVGYNCGVNIPNMESLVTLDEHFENLDYLLNPEIKVRECADGVELVYVYLKNISPLFGPAILKFTNFEDNSHCRLLLKNHCKYHAHVADLFCNIPTLREQLEAAITNFRETKNA